MGNMKKFEPELFQKKLIKRISSKTHHLICPYCGYEKFTTTKSLAAILTGEEINNLTIGSYIPSGMLICEKCGHIEFFALGVLGMNDNQQNEKKQNND